MHPNLLPLFISYGYPIIFIFAFLEGPVITMAAAFFASMGYFNIVFVYGIVVFADLIADVCWYMVGFYGRSHGFGFAARFLKGKDHEKPFSVLEKHITTHQGKLIFMAKLTHAFGVPFLIMAGVYRINFKKFISFNFFATIVKSLILVIIGYYYGQAHIALSRYLGFSSFLAVVVLAIAFATVFVIQRFLHSSFKKYE
jgi:membrane protein DedA with SNARE-associated domain